VSRIHLVIGSNGAGKTTFVEEYLSPLLPGVPFVNADVIARQRWPEAPEAHSYEAARIANRTRLALVEAEKSFIAETVFSHPSKLELIRMAQDHGCAVHLHVMLVPEDLTVLRVRARVAAGGHHVPEAKIRGRYHRMWGLAAQAASTTDTARFYDNSAGSGPRLLARLARGVPLGVVRWPEWTPLELTTVFPDT
jgi:predicted ABC-type ATPase